MLKKIKAFFLTREKKKDGPRSTGTGRIFGTVPRAPRDRSASLGLDHTAAGLSIVISPPDHPPAMDPVAGTLLFPPEESSHVVGEGAAVSMISVHSVDTPDSFRNGHRSVLRSPSPGIQKDTPQDTSIVANSHSIEHATFQQGTFANARSVHIGTAYMNDYGQSEDEKRAEQERRTREELRAEKERKAKEEKYAEEEKRAKEERAEREKRAKEEREAEERKQEEKALEKLVAKGMPGAMLDSKDRGYVPRCNEDTRNAIRRRIVQWGRSGAEMHRLRWLSGPAGVGKSAVAQTVAEVLKEEGLLGAAFFFSRPNNRSDPDVLIPTLVYQLALLLPEYRRIISQRLTKDPLILNKNRHSQFKELIINPFLSLTAYLPSIAQKPILVVLDGLDECNDREAQCEFVDMISNHAHKEGAALRLRWLICSRPEPDLKVAFSRENCRTICLEERLEVEDTEAQRDARRILAKGFTEIRLRYPDQLAEDWPPEGQVRFIAERASGHLGFVSFLLRFIGDKCYDDPSGQLEVCLRFLQLTGSFTNLNPLHSLDLLYTQILSDIPTNILPTTQCILGLFILYNAGHLSTIALANFLGLDRPAFYRSLQRLHSVILVPPASEADKKPIQVYHASFSDYLKDRTRSERFFLEEGIVPYVDVATSGLKWLGHGHRDTSKRVRPRFTWTPPKASYQKMLDSLCKFSFMHCWKACLKVPKDSQATLFEALENFDFNLDYNKWGRHDTEGFAYFIRWLVTSADQHKTLIAAREVRQTEITYSHRADPSTFSLPFPKDMQPWGPHILIFRLGKNNPVNFSLQVGRG